jgi:virulence factor Mce-like protein
MNVHASVKLGPDARAAIKVSTLLGAHYVDLSPGDGSGLPKGRIQQTNTAVPYNLADVIQVGTPKFEALDANKLAATLNVINAQLGSSAPLAAQALDSVGALSKEINSRRDQFDSLLRNLSTVTSILSDDRADLLTLITQGDRIGARIMQREQLVRQLLDTTAELTRELQQIGAQNNGKIGPTIRELDVISQGLQKNKDNLDRLLQIMPVAARQYNNASGDGNYTNLYMPWGLFPDNWLCFAQVVPGCK